MNIHAHVFFLKKVCVVNLNHLTSCHILRNAPFPLPVPLLVIRLYQGWEKGGKLEKGVHTSSIWSSGEYDSARFIAVKKFVWLGNEMQLK